MRRLTLFVPVLSVALLLAAPAVSSATLTFVRNPFKPVIWVAEDSGGHARPFAAGSAPKVSPDGRLVAYSPATKGGASSDLVVASVDGAAEPHRLLSNWREPFALDWSPDSSTVAVLRGPEVGRLTLVLIDVATGAQRVVAKGFFSGFSFAPRGGQLVYARAGSEAFPPRSDVYRYDIPVGQTVRAAAPVQLTHDHRSADPLWGPNGKIAFVKRLGAKQRRYGPKNELYLMGESGKGVRRLTHTKVGPLLQGLYPTAWSANGKRLLAEFEGQDTTYAVTVNPRTGAQRPLVEATERGFLGRALSTDGKLVLGSTGGFEPGPGNDVATIPYGGGSPKVLAKNAFEPSWSH